MEAKGYFFLKKKYLILDLKFIHIQENTSSMESRAPVGSWEAESLLWAAPAELVEVIAMRGA